MKFAQCRRDTGVRGSDDFYHYPEEVSLSTPLTLVQMFHRTLLDLLVSDLVITVLLLLPYISVGVPLSVHELVDLVLPPLSFPGFSSFHFISYRVTSSLLQTDRHNY